MGLDPPGSLDTQACGSHITSLAACCHTYPGATVSSSSRQLSAWPGALQQAATAHIPGPGRKTSLPDDPGLQEIGPATWDKVGALETAPQEAHA